MPFCAAGVSHLIHFSTMLKVDIFVRGTDQFNASVWKLRLSKAIEIDEESFLIWFATPEDVVLHKLPWYRKRGQTPERQWRDISAVLKQQWGRLNLDYLAKWADQLPLRDLWERASNEVTLE
jgi:hypothetical protein